MHEVTIVADKQPRLAHAMPVAPFRPRAGVQAKAVGSFVSRLTQKAVQKYGFSAAALITDWRSIVGEDLARYTEPQRLKWPRGVEAYGEMDADAAGRPGATLVLRVDGARALDVQYSARQIIERINGYFGYRAVADLRLIQAPAEPALSQPKPRDVMAGKVRATAAATDLGHIADDQLRAALERLQRSMAKG